MYHNMQYYSDLLQGGLYIPCCLTFSFLKRIETSFYHGKSVLLKYQLNADM